MYKLSAIEIRNLFLNGKVSATEITKYFLNRIEKGNQQLSAFLEVFQERSLKKANILDDKYKKKLPIGKLAAIPFAIKDNIHIKGEKTTCGSKFLENYRAIFDATVIEHLELDDAILMGKTNLDEFAMGSSTENSAFVKTHNPWNLKCVPGGSSGGSAAAVSARLTPLALGSDTGGSIRQPASFCGISGFKPTYGRVSRYGLVAFGSSLDQIGPLGFSCKDIALTMEIIGAHSENDSTSLQLPNESYLDSKSSFTDMVIGIPYSFLKDISKPLGKNFQDIVQVLTDLGAKFVDINLDILKYSISVYYILATAEASTNLARFDGIKYGVRHQNSKTLDEVYDLSRDEGFGNEVKRRIMLGTYVLSAGYKDAYYQKAQKVRTLMIKAFEDAFTKCDLIIMPTSPSTAFELAAIQDPLSMYLQDLFTIGANLAGVPAISVPSGFDEKQKPFGLQILGPQLHDASVVKHACVFEQATGFGKKIPPLFDKEL